MSDKALKIVPAPEAKTSPDTKSGTTAAVGLFARIGRKRLRMILLVGLPALAIVIGLVSTFPVDAILRPTTRMSAHRKC